MRKLNKAATRKIVLMAILIAMQVVLSRFLSINLQFLKIGFSFIPLMFAAYLFGPVGGVTVAAVSDIIGAIAFPSGQYFIGFTVSAALTGLIYGLTFGKKCTTLKIALGVVANEVICGLLLNTLWLSIMYTSAFSALIATRVWQVLAMIAVQIVFGEIFFNRLNVAKRMKSEINKK